MTDDQILEKLGLTNVDDVSRKVLIAQVNNVVDKRLMNLVIELISDEQMDEFEKLQQAGDNEAVWTWLSAQLNMDELYQGVLNDYLEERVARG